MNILFISHLLPYPLRSGAALRNHGVIKELSQENDLDIITFSQKVLIANEIELKHSISETEKICRELKVFNIPTDRSKSSWYILLFLNLFGFLPYSVWRFWSQEVADTITKMCKSKKYDLVHIDTIALAQYASFCGGAKLILNHHNVESSILFRRASIEKNIFAKSYIYIQALKLFYYEKKMSAKFALNVCVSDRDAKMLKDNVGEIQTFVVPNGVDTDYFHPKEDQEKDVEQEGLIFIGSMTWFPNLEGMIWFCKDVYPLIKAKIPNVYISIIGSVPHGDLNNGQSSELVKLADLDPSIRLLGAVDDVRPHIAHSRVFVVPLRIGGGTRLKILDAMASQKAIVSTTIGAEGLDVVHENDIMIADTACEFANRVIEVYIIDPVRLQMESKAREKVSILYSWNVIGPNLRKAYEDIICNKL